MLLLLLSQSNVGTSNHDLQKHAAVENHSNAPTSKQTSGGVLARVTWVTLRGWVGGFGWSNPVYSLLLKIKSPAAQKTVCVMSNAD